MTASPLKSMLLSAPLLVAVLMASLPAQAELTNPGFETGDTTGWQTRGQVGVSNEHPNQGSYHAILISTGATVAEIEEFLGLEDGAIASVIGGEPSSNPVNGAAIKQTFTGTAGDEIELFYNYLNDEGNNEEVQNDSAVTTLAIQDEAAVVTLLSDTYDNDQSITNGSITSPYPYSWERETGYRSYTVTLPESGELTLGFAILNVFDDMTNAGLMLDDGPVTPPPVEPRSIPSLSQWSLMLTTLLLGALGLIATRHRTP